MDWTGGTRWRFSRSQKSQISRLQKAYFAKARCKNSKRSHPGESGLTSDSICQHNVATTSSSRASQQPHVVISSSGPSNQNDPRESCKDDEIALIEKRQPHVKRSRWLGLPISRHQFSINFSSAQEKAMMGRRHHTGRPLLNHTAFDKVDPIVLPSTPRRRSKMHECDLLESAENSSDHDLEEASPKSFLTISLQPMHPDESDSSDPAQDAIMREVYPSSFIPVENAQNIAASPTICSNDRYAAQLDVLGSRFASGASTLPFARNSRNASSEQLQTEIWHCELSDKAGQSGGNVQNERLWRSQHGFLSDRKCNSSIEARQSSDGLTSRASIALRPASGATDWFEHLDNMLSTPFGAGTLTCTSDAIRAGESIFQSERKTTAVSSASIKQQQIDQCTFQDRAHRPQNAVEDGDDALWRKFVFGNKTQEPTKPRVLDTRNCASGVRIAELSSSESSLPTSQSPDISNRAVRGSSLE